MYKRQEFASTEVFAFSMHPDFVDFDLPTRSSRPRYERWMYRDGTFTRYLTARAVSSSAQQGRIDLRKVDWEALLATVEKARAAFHVPGAPWYAIGRNDYSGREVLVYTVNKYSEGGYIATTFAGKEIRRIAF